MADEETSPLKPKLTDEDNMVNISSISPKYSPPTIIQHQESTLKIELLKLLKSTDNNEEYLPNNELNTDYENQLLLEEEIMINKLHNWIEHKGKPAISKVDKLEMKCETYEQNLCNTKYEIQTLKDEINKINKDKNDLLIKYENEKQYKNELKQTIKTLQIHQTEEIIKYENINTNNNEINNKISEINELNKQINNLKFELLNQSKLNIEYEEQNNSLKTIINNKNIEINKLTNDKNDWENNANMHETDLLDRIAEINQLRKENNNYKHQIEILKPNETFNTQQLTNGKTIRGLLSNDTSSADLSSEPNAFLPDKSMGINGMYTQQSTASILIGHHNRNSTDFDKIFQLENQLKNERISHKLEVETLSGKLKELKLKMDNDSKELQHEIQRLKEENAQKSEGCNGCVVM